MIVFVSTASHRYTHAPIAARLPCVRQMSYPALFTHRWLPRATYIFSDFDRLNFWQVELAAHIYRVLKADGCHVLNDPARALSRLELLRKLNRDGVNSFTAWPGSEADVVDRFPVFLRTISAHRGNRTDILQDAASLDRALAELIRSGWPLSDLMISEYRAEPFRGDIFRKLSAYRVGDRVFQSPSVHERHWSAKYGEHGVGDAETYSDDLRMVRENPYRDDLVRAFDLAGVEYGRADFGLVGGRPEIYEINTNPSMETPGDHPFKDRLRAIDLTETAYEEAMRALDTNSLRGRIRIRRPDQFAPRQKALRLLPGHQWTP